MTLSQYPSSNNPLRQMKSEALYAQLGRIIESAPNLKVPLPGRIADYPDLTPEQMQWLGRARALVNETFGSDIEFRTAMSLFAHYRARAADQMMQILYSALATVEMELPAPATGAFIPAGNTFDALKAVQRVFETARRDILVVDPYLDEKILTDFAVLAPTTIPIRLLTDSASYKASLVPAMKYFEKQYGSNRPLFIRASPPKSLHDRLVAIDGQRIWTVGQSFNAMAARAPTSFVEVDKETTALKATAYETIWNAASPIKAS